LTHIGSQPLRNGASGRVQFRASIGARYQTFILRTGCLVDRHLGSRRRSRSHRARCRYRGAPCHAGRTTWLVSLGVRAIREGQRGNCRTGSSRVELARTSVSTRTLYRSYPFVISLCPCLRLNNSAGTSKGALDIRLTFSLPAAYLFEHPAVPERIGRSVR
jgi:hypothetical protein